MTSGEIVELVFGFVILGFMIFITIGVFIGMVSDSKTPKRRRRRPPTYRNYKINWAELRDFEYTGSHNSSEFLVYFI